MAGTKISELPVATLPLTGSELVPVVQSGATKQTTLATMPYVPTGTGAITTTVQAKLRETVSVKDFGAVGDGVTDNSVAFANAIASGAKRIFVPAGIHFFAAAPVWTSLTNITFIGDNSGASLLRWNDGRFAIKAPSDVNFEHIGFSPNSSNTLYPEIFVSNYTNIKFENCRFEGFGAVEVNKAGSTCLYMYAGDVASSTVAAGDSNGGVVTNCEFAGNGRRTNFGVRVYTEFTGSTAINVNNRISNCTFSGFNWNACEIAGPQTAYNIVSNCTALLCGLAPFDLDKGCNNNTVTNCVIRRLLGNIDLIANPNTRTTVASVQGVSPSAGYAYNNTIRNIVAYLSKTDLDAYGNGCSAVIIAYAQNNVIDGVTVYCDGVPVRGAGGRFGLACASFATAAGNQIRNVLVNNASAGIVQTEAQNAGMTSTEPNVFENIKNIGTMTEEAIQIAAGASPGAFSRNIVRNVDFKTALSNPFYTSYTYLYAVVAFASGSASNFLKIKDSTIDLASSASLWFVMDQISRLALENVDFHDNGTLASTRFIHSEGSTLPAYLGLCSVAQNFGQEQINLSTALQFLDSTAGIGAKLSDRGLPFYDSTTLFSSAQPSFPAAANWNSNLRVERTTKAANSFEGWTVVSGAWKTYGTVSA